MWEIGYFYSQLNYGYKHVWVLVVLQVTNILFQSTNKQMISYYDIEFLHIDQVSLLVASSLL